ncbi:MAG TPA: hypothetical protein VK532_05335 [Gaiellaceae bacterium]|nr:hypothetical protein [Gaiellaceae bacterium]
MKGSSPGLLVAAATPLARAPLTLCAGFFWTAGVLTAGSGAEETPGPPDDPPLPGVDELVVVGGVEPVSVFVVVVVVSFVVVFWFVVVVSFVVVSSVVVGTVVVVSAWSQ